MATSVSYPAPGQPLPPIKDTDEGATACSSSSSEDEYHINLNGHHPSEVIPSFEARSDFVTGAQVAQATGTKRSRDQKSPVSATDLLRAAKMAQAAGRCPMQSLKVPGKAMEPPKKRLNTDKKPYMVNRIHALPVKNACNGSSSEPVYTAASTANMSRSTPKNQSADFVKLEKAFRAVDTMAVVGRLCRVDGIMPDLALHVVYEYLRFIILLIRCQDWNATMLWPSPMVDLAWRQHVLDTVRYLSDCQSICGRFIHYNPDAELGGQELCTMKYLRTLALYKSVFGDPPAAIWPVEQDLIPTSSMLPQNAQLASVAAGSIQLICRVPTGATLTIDVNLNENVDQIFGRLRNWQNVTPESHILVFNGDILDTNTLLKNLELRQGMTIDVIPAVNAR